MDKVRALLVRRSVSSITPITPITPMHSIHDILHLLRRAGSKALAVAGLVMALGMTSCSGDNSIIDEPQEGGEVWISFNIANQGAFTGYAQSRSNDDTQGHPDEDATAYENYVDINDLHIIFFGPDKRAFKSFTSADLSLTSVNPYNNQYRLTARIDKDLFQSAGAGSRISIMAVANVTGTKNADPSGIGGTFPIDVIGKTYEDLSAQLNTYTFLNAKDATGNTVNAGSWRPDGSENRIPMTGLLHTVAPSEVQLATATSMVAAYDLTSGHNLELQRAMVKIRILDGVKALSTLTSNKPHIKSVTLKGGNVKGAYLPLYLTGFSPQWFLNGTSVLERSAKPTNTTDWADYKTLGLDEKETWFEMREEEEQVLIGSKYFTRFMCYAPEQHSVSSGTVILQPYLEIIVKEGYSATSEEKPYKIYLKDVLNTSYNDMVRNHIYEFTVTRSEKAMLDVTYKICPWSTMSSGDINFD